jgi:phosphoribosylanthranilate isomerase
MKKRVRVKICGITCAEDALAAVEAGADALGFMFYERSSRYIAPQEAARIITQLPPFVSKTGVFVDASPASIAETIAQCRLDCLQFHGTETPEMCQHPSLPVVKAFRVAGEECLQIFPTFKTAAWLLDSYVPGQLGGTGAKFNWDLAVAAAKLGRPIILAGGLTSENVAEAVRQTQPFAVDVSSGVESSPGRKDRTKMHAFIQAVRSAI